MAIREIIFRGKRVDNGEWIYGDLLCSKGNYYIHERGKPIVSYISPMAAFGTVGEWTGLTDKNGKKIFEGDVLRLRDSWSAWAAIVEFGNPNGLYSWGWQLKPIRRVSVNTDILCWVEMEDTGAYCEVIGNIHDNPELLEGAK